MMEHNLKTCLAEAQNSDCYCEEEIKKTIEELQNLEVNVDILALQDSGFTPKMAYINGFNDCKKLMLGV